MTATIDRRPVPNSTGLAIGDIRVAAAILAPRTSRVKALDVRDLEGGRACAAHSERVFDLYCGAIDAGLAHLVELRTRGYKIERVPPC